MILVSQTDKYQPLPFFPSLLYFGVPAALMAVGFYWLMPLLIAGGMLPYYAYILGLGIPLMLMLVGSILYPRFEGLEIIWSVLRERYRLNPLGKSGWLWSLGALLVGPVIGFFAFSRLSDLLRGMGLIKIPVSVPDFISPDVIGDPNQIYDAAVGGLIGNWPFFLVMVVLFVINILGEELWWRGVVLPRQELAFGKWAWVIHGLLWTLFHAYKWWDLLSLLPISLALSFVASKKKNTTAGILIHGVTNGIALVPLFFSVLGWV